MLLGRHQRWCTMTVVRAYVGVTDGDWFRFLAARPEVAEANFWQPSGGRDFRVLAPGEPFFFKTHYPHNKVVGGGFFSDSARLKVSEAWELFGEANGAASIEQMRARIGHHRHAPIAAGEDPAIGCLFVRDVRFFAADISVDPPPGFAPNIVQGKSYDLADQAVAEYFTGLLQLILGVVVLQAAHIRPVTAGGEHRLDNGLLLRSDVHTLFDRGYLGVDAKYRLRVSPRLREDFSNGDQFYAMAGQVIGLPERRSTGLAPSFWNGS